MKTKHNILTKIFLILLIAAGWGSTAWAQTSQLPLASGVYELKNISNDGDGVGRGYLVSYTAHSSGLGLAECPWGTYTGYHPDNRNNGSTTCSYFYLHANDNGTYTLVSLSTLGGNSEPRFVRVGANQQTSTLSDTEVELNITERTAVSRDGKYSVLISNAGQSIYLSAACGNNSTTSSGAVGATGTASDGGVPWLFISIPSSTITPAQRAIIDKYLGNVHVLAASEYTLDPASLSKVESLSSVTINLNVAGMTVKCANEDGGVFTDENRPYLILASAHSKRRAHHKAPAGAIPADNVTKTSDGVYDITFDPAVEADGIYDLVVPQGAFVLNDGVSDFPITEFSARYTVGEVAPGKWYIMKVHNGGYVSSDYVDGSNNMLLNNNTKPTNYAGIWMNVPETTVDAKGQGNVKLVNAKYYNDRTFGMLKGAGDGGSDRAQMYPTTSALPTDVSNVFECKVYTGQDDSYYFTLPGTNRYFNSRNGYLGSWDTSTAFGKTGSRFVIEEVPVLGTNVTITVNAPGGEVIKYNTQCEDPAFLALGNVHDVTMTNGNFNFHNMPFVPSLFSLDPADPSKILTATFDKDAQTLSLAVAVDPNYLQFSDAPANGEWAANTKWFTWRNNRSNQDASHNRHYMSTSANSVNDDYSLAPTQGTMPADRGSYWCFVGDNTSGFQIYNAAYGPDFVLGGLGDGTSVKYYMVNKDDAAGYNTSFTSVESTVKDGASYGYAFRLGTSGNNHIHVTNSTIRNWNDGGGITTDTGSSFMIEQAELPALGYDVYKVETIGAIGYTGIDYTPVGNTFGKRITAKNNDILILKAGSEIAVANFVAAPADYAIATATSNDDATHYYKHLTLKVRDALATDEYTIKVTDGTKAADLDVDAVDVRYVGEGVKNGETIYARPTAHPKETDFVVNGQDDKFIWGPVIDHTAKTVTFDIRDVATAFTTGLYQMMLLDEANINTVNGYIDMFAGDNINTSSNYIYIAPSVYGKDGAKFKFTGVPSYASEAATAVYLTDNTNGTLNLEATGGAKFENVAYTFDADSHILTLTGYGPKNYGYSGEQPNFEPKEMPQLTNQNGPTRYYLYAADTTPYDYYFVDLVNGSGTTTVKYNKPSLTGTTNYADNSLLVVKKGTQFTLTDFSPSDTRVLGVEITNVPNETTPGVLTITLENMVSEWTGIITSDAGLDVTGYQVKFNGATYASGTKLLIPAHLEPREVVSTTCTDKFVWGPIVDEDAKTLTFDIRPVPATLEPGFYQFMLIEDPDNTNTRNRANVAEINARIKNNGSSSINTTGSYIYVMPPYKETSYLAKYNGIPSYGAEPTTFFHITEVGTTAGKLSIQNVKGYYSHEGGRADKTATTTAGDLAFYTFNAGILGLQRWVPGGYWGNTNNNGPSNAAEGPGVAAGDNGVYHEKYYITKVDLSSYDVYRLEVLDGSDNSVIATVNCGSNLGAPSVITGGYFFFPTGTPISASLFKTIGYSYEGASTVADAEGIKTITFRAESGLQNMIVHRQHGVFDQLEATPAALRPTSTNYIQAGDGMLDQPYKGTFTGSGYIANDMTMQNTSVFHVYQYVIPGQTTQVVLPFTRNKGDLGSTPNQYSHIANYQRWYNYKTERPLDDDIIKLPSPIDESHKTYLGNTVDYYRFDNGHSNFGLSGGEIVRQQAVLGNTYLNFPDDTDELLVAVDASEFLDQDGKIGNKNLLEPSLNERVVFHLIDANQMTNKLSVKGTTTAEAGKKLWWEDHAFYVPRIKRGTNDYDNNVDLLPLDMAWTYYFVPNSSGDPMPLLAESTEWNGHNTNNYNTLKDNIEITVEGPAAPYLEVGVHTGQYGVADSPFITTNHFLYYMMKGVENRTSGERSVPDGSQAIIKVYGKNDAGTLYQLARFTLNFVADSEPLAITSVYGQDPNAPISHRSEDYFDNSGFTRVAELTFQNKSVQFDYDAMASGRGGADSERKATYAFPIDFRRTSYGYSAQNTYGQYKIGTLNYGITYGPAELYRKNIQTPSSTALKIADDYLFYIDAAETPGQVASVPLEGTLCAGTRLYCYGYIGSTNYYDNQNVPPGEPASVVLNLVGRKTSGDDAGATKIIASYLPGMISDIAYTNDGTPMRSLAYGRTPSIQKAGWRQDGTTLMGPWQQIGFSFTLSEEDSHYDEFELQIINNCHSTAGGDYLLDDFTVYANPPRAKMEFSAPLCYDHIPHLKITAPYDLLRGAQRVDSDDPNSDYRISYCFLDHKKYAAALATATTEAEKKAAFNSALMGNSTASDTYADGKVTQYRSFWNLSVASTDAGYEAYHDYTFQSALEATSSDVTAEQAASPYASVQAAVFKQMVGSERQIVFATEIGNSLGWEVGEDYDLVFTGGWVTSDFENASSPYNLAGGPNQCSFYDTFTVRPSIIVITDMEDADYTNPTACEGQSVSMSVSLPGLGPDGKSTFLQFMQYDWWIGYGQTVKGGDKSTITPATVHNFNQEKFGTYTTATAEHAVDEDVYLITALKNFRRLYPTAIDLRVCPPTSGIDATGQDVTFTQEEWDCVNHFIQPDDNARIPLILGKRAIDFLVRAEDADADHNVYVTIIPIEPLAPFDGTENVIYCPDPQQVAIRIESAAPHMFNGFTELHDKYPSQMHAVPVRMGLDQFEETRLSNTGQMGPHHLRIPLRGIKTVNNPTATGAKIIKRKHKKVQASDADTYQDLIYLVGTDDPRYSDPNSEDFFIESVNEKTGDITFRTVGLVNTFNAPTTGDAHMEIGFANNFQPHEGFTYTLKFMFQEDIPSTYTGASTATCPGAFTFDLKIVPKYIQWVAEEGNGEWNNDRNWARADRDVLHADNAASDGTTPLAGYTSNAANYGDDQLYTQIGNAHSFVPMYFTNVLLHDGSLLPPALYALTPPAKSGNNYTGFLGGLKETAPDATATRFIKYDMLVTPIANEGFWNLGQATMTPLPLVQRYGATAANKNYGCEAFDSNVCNGLTFEPATAMYDAQYLSYNKAWVEYELKTNRWYTLASPLQDTYAGEWYSPEAGGRQLTPHFYAIKYNEALNDRFNPAYYQRSWDKAGEAWIYRMNGDEGTYVGFEHDRHADNVRVQKPIYLNWSYVYNDVTVPYSNGGFSVNVRYTDQGKDADGKALVRMPKDDDSYLYYQSEASAAVGNTNGQNPDGSNTDAGVARPNGVASGDYTQITRSTATHHRLMSDMLRSGSTINQSIVNASASNPYYLIGNPLMAPLDMEKFFQQNTQFVDHAEKVKNDDGSPALGQDGAPLETHDGLKYWIMSDGLQEVSMKVNGNWISTNGSDGVVAPLQGFFVRVASDDEGKATATFPNGMQVKYTAEMQKKDFTADVPAPSLRAPRRSDAQPGIFRITATNDSQLESNAVVYFSEQASNAYNTAEDAETLLDGNIADKVSTVFTAADEQALSINSMSTTVSMIPVGVIAPKDDTRTTLSFTGLSSLEAVMEGTPHIYDADDDTFMVLDEDTKLTVTGTSVGRYFIVTGTTLPFVDEEAAADDETDGHIYNLNGIRIATPQHGTVTIHGSRKEYNK